MNQNKPNLSHLIKQNDAPDYIGTTMETTIFSPQGKKQYFAKADKVAYFGQDEHTEFTAPEVFLFDPPIAQNKSEDKEKSNKIQLDSQNWQLRADFAKLTQNEMLYLQGNVVVQSLDAQSKLQRVETDNAVVNLKTQDIQSDSQVKINGLNFTSTGLKLLGNLRQQTATLKEQVKTYYEVKQN